MNLKETSTPLAASDIRFPRPRQSFVQPRNLDKDDNTEHTTESTPMNYAEESGTTPLSPYLVKLLLEESASSTKKISDAAVKNTAVEKGAPLWITATTEGWMEFDYSHKAYQHIGGQEGILKLTDKDNLEYIATYILEDTVEVLKTMTDPELRNLFNKYFNVEEATSYSTELPKLYMPKSTNFSRDAIQKFASIFLKTLLRNPNYSIPTKGGTTPKKINEMFISGIQPSAFVVDIKRYGTETVNDTNKVIQLHLPKFQQLVNMGGYTSNIKPVELTITKIPQKSIGAKNGGQKCQHCDQPGHGYLDCPSKAECLRCKTAAHPYWHRDCAYRQSKFAQRDNLQKGPQAKAMAAVVSAPANTELADLKASVASLATLMADLIAKVKRKKKLLDSGANISIISDTSHLDPNTTFCRAEEPRGVETANQSVMAISGSGTICGLEGALCDDAASSLISVSQLCKAKKAAVILDSCGAVAVTLDDEGIATLNEFKNNCFQKSQLLLTAHVNHDSLYELDVSPVPPMSVNFHNATLVNTSIPPVSYELHAWSPSPEVLQSHYTALGAYYYTADLPRYRDIVRFFHEAWDHPSEELMCRIVNDKVFDNIPKELTAKVIRKHFPQCEACPAGNMAQRDIPREASDRVILPGEEFQVDIKVFASTSKALKHKRAFGRYTGALTAIDLSTRFKIGKLIRSHASLEVELEALRIEVHGSGHTLRVLRLDNEFVTVAIEKWAASCDPPIELQPCIPHEHHSIGDIERFNQTMGDAIFKKLYGQKHLSVQYWGMAYTDYIMKANFMGSLHGPKECPYELWTGKHPDLIKLPMIPFGSVVMAHVPKDLQTTSGPKSIRTYAVGTALGHQGGLRLFNPLTKREVIRRTYKILGPETQSLDRPEYELSADGDVTLAPVSEATVLVSHDVLDYKYLIGTLHRDVDFELTLFKTMDVVEETFDETEGPVIVAYRRRVTETGKLLPMTEDEEYPYHIHDVVLMTAEYATDHPDKVSKAVKVQLTSLLCTMGSDKNHPTDSRLGTPLATDYWKGRLPRSIAQVLSMPLHHPDRAGFLAATTAEIKSLRDMETWDPAEVLSPEQMKISGIGMSRCVFTKKYHPDGSFDKYKCRIVFRGDRWYDLYCNKTYAGCVMSETVRLLLSVAATEDMEVASLDVKTAFLYGLIPITQFIYMRRPAGLTDTDMPAIIRLQKCIYGLPHAPATFRNHSDVTLRSFGFIPTVSDPRLYVRMLANGTKAYVAVHVDDFGIAASTTALKEETMAAIRTVYNCVEGDLGAYLGMQLVRDRVKRTITISQPGYLEDLREQFGITSTMGPLTPMVDKEREPESESNPRLDAAGIRLYQSKVGSVLWPAMGTRPEIQYATNIHSRYTKSPLRGDMVTLNRVLDYIVNTPELGLVLGGHGGVKLYATVDASYGTHDDRKSHSGCTLHIGEGSGAFLSRSKKQTVTADSSTVAEFIATHLAAKEIMWARSLLEEMGYTQSDPTVLGEDNMSTIAMINNDCNGQKTKHIAIRFNLIREQVQNSQIKLQHLSTTEMTSDILTKALDPKPFEYLRTKLLGMMARAV